MKIDYFLGIGQGKRSQEWLERNVKYVSFHAAPDYLHCTNDEEMKELGIDYVSCVLNDRTDYIVMAESQAAPAVIEALYQKRIPQPKRLILLLPLGFNSESLGLTPHERRHELLQRSMRIWMHKNQSLMINGNRWTAQKILLDSARNLPRVGKAFLFGANQDIRQRAESIAAGIPLDVYCK